MNLGLNSKLREAFPDWENNKVIRSEHKNINIKDPNWIAGFSSGDGSFNVKISSSTTNKIGNKVQLRFSIGLKVREKELIKAIVTYFNLDVSKNIYYSKNSVSLQVTKFSDIIGVIIPFFQKYPIQGLKSLDFCDFFKIANMLKKNEHVTSKGFNKIILIKKSRNENRT